MSFLCAVVKAQTIQLVKDVNITAKSSSNIQEISSAGGKLFFKATDGVAAGQEIWTSDGTAAGTLSLQQSTTSSQHFTSFTSDYNGLAYFVNNNALYKSDGTATGTVQVSTHFVRRIIGVYLNKIFLDITDPTTGTEVWTSDGTAAGTVLLKDINPNADAAQPNNVQMVEHNGKVYFDKDDNGTHNEELWVSDGTTANTQKLKEINPSGGSNLSYFFSLNNQLFFCHTPNNTKVELWSTDGTTTGTTKITDLGFDFTTSNIGLYNTIIAQPEVFNGKGYFTGYNLTTNRAELWETDGTTAGTQYVRDHARPIGTHNNKLYLSNDIDKGLYVMDATQSITKIKALDSNIGGGIAPGAVQQFEIVNGRVYFMSTAYYFGAVGQPFFSYLWTTDGTDTGTQLITPHLPQYYSVAINPGNIFDLAPIRARSFAVMNNEIYIAYMADTITKYELYKYTPPAGPNAVRNISQATLGVYPNPATNNLHINLLYKGSINQPLGLSLIDITGRTAWHNHFSLQQNNFTTTVPLQNMPPGIYILKASINGTDIIRKIVKQ